MRIARPLHVYLPALLPVLIDIKTRLTHFFLASTTSGGMSNIKEIVTSSIDSAVKAVATNTTVVQGNLVGNGALLKLSFRSRLIVNSFEREFCENLLTFHVTQRLSICQSTFTPCNKIFISERISRLEICLVVIVVKNKVFII